MRDAATIAAVRPSAELVALLEAVAYLQASAEPLTNTGRRWRTRAAAHLEQRLDLELHGGVRPFTGEAQALELLKGSARDLRAAAEALFGDAERFRSLGLAWNANRAFHAATAAQTAADQLDPA